MTSSTPEAPEPGTQESMLDLSQMMVVRASMDDALDVFDLICKSPNPSEKVLRFKDAMVKSMHKTTRQLALRKAKNDWLYDAIMSARQSPTVALTNDRDEER